MSSSNILASPIPEPVIINDQKIELCESILPDHVIIYINDRCFPLHEAKRFALELKKFIDWMEGSDE